MRRHDKPLRLFLLTLCIAVVAAFSFGCNDRRSEGQKPVIVDEEEDAPFAQRNKAEPQQVGEYEHVAQVQRFEGGIEPNDYKARKLVNQLFNYCVGVCSANMECPENLDAAREAVRKQYSLFWPKDPWGNLYQYKRIDVQTCDVWSMGPDGKDGTEDDVHISEANRDNLPN